MKWTRRIQIDVEISDRNRGHNHFSSGTVKIKSGGPGKVTASVNGSGEHVVEIKVDRDAVVAFCDCSRFGSGKFCEHIWGTLLAAESGGHLRRIASMWAPYLEHGLDHVEDGTDNPDGAIDGDGPDSTAYDFTESEPESPTGSTARRAKQPKPPKVPPWKEHVSALRQSANVRYLGANTESRRLLYFVDISECLSAGTFIVQSVLCRMKKSGEWGRPNFQESFIRDIGQFGSADMQLLSLLSPSSVSYG
jgi:hypothetical protein